MNNEILYKLSQEFCDLYSTWENHKDDPEEYPMDQDDKDRYAELTDLNAELAGLLDYPTRCRGVFIVDEDERRAYAETWFEARFDVDGEYLVRANMDWDGLADDLLTDYHEVEFDGETFWINL
jgi:hypothetical protein